MMPAGHCNNDCRITPNVCMRFQEELCVVYTTRLKLSLQSSESGSEKNVAELNVETCSSEIST